MFALENRKSLSNIYTNGFTLNGTKTSGQTSSSRQSSMCPFREVIYTGNVADTHTLLTKENLEDISDSNQRRLKPAPPQHHGEKSLKRIIPAFFTLIPGCFQTEPGKCVFNVLN